MNEGVKDIDIQNCIFFFKQKTAYEIYQCDWSSDVCSSDLCTQKDLERIRYSCEAYLEKLKGMGKFDE